MVELLIVISLILLLMAIFAVGMQNVKKKMRVSRTVSLVERVGIALESYHSAHGAYPSDGIESPVVTRDGTRLKSGAALTHALTRPMLKTRTNAAGERIVMGKSEPLLDLPQGELTKPLEGDKEAVEMVDAWGNELHYDNLSGDTGRFDEQGDGSVHLSDLDEHEEDPRTTELVIRDGAQSTGKFDFWSHGLGGHSEESVLEATISNWGTVATGEDEDD